MESYLPTALAFLCSDLGYKTASLSTELRAYMEAKLAAAWERLEADGVSMAEPQGAVMDLWVMYAAWLYRRRDSDLPMPRVLRLALNDAKVQKAKEALT